MAYSGAFLERWYGDVHRRATTSFLHFLLARAHKQGLQSKYQYSSKRLLYVAASCLPYHISGYTTRTQAILRVLVAAGCDVCAMTRPGYPWDRPDILVRPENGQRTTPVDIIRYAHVPTPTNSFPTAIFAGLAANTIAKYAKQVGAGCIHAASNHVNALPALLAARRLGIPFQYEIRGLWELTRASRQADFENSPWYRLGLELEGFVASNADKLFVISEQVGRYAQEHWGILSSKMFLLPNCVDSDAIKPNPDIKILPNTIGYGGSLIGYEGLDTLLEAMAILVSKGVAIYLRIAGDGEARSTLEKMTAALGLQRNVTFLGKLPPAEARNEIERCAIVCIPRKPYEVCRVVPPIKLVEALALAKPVIVPNLPVFQDEVGENPSGKFFKAGDAEDLANVLQNTFAEPENLAKLGAMGRAYVLQHRQWHQFVNNLIPDNVILE